MGSAEVRKEIEQLSGVLVLAEPGDTGALAEIRRRLEGVRRGAAGRGKTRIVAIARRAEALVARTLYDEVPLGERLPEAIGCAVSALQGILREGSEPREIAEWFDRTIESIENAARADRDGSTTSSSDPGTHTGTGESPATTAAPFAGDPELCADFVVEAREHLESIEEHMLVLEKDPRDGESLNALFRAFHTIKGVAVHLGLEAISSLAHEAENLLDLVRSGAIGWDGRTVEIVFEAGDVMKRLIDGLAGSLEGSTPAPSDATLPSLLARIRELAALRKTAADAAEPAAADVADGEALEAGDAGSGPTAASGGAKVRELMRVDAERLDRLVEAIGELVTAVSVFGGYVDLRLGEDGRNALNEVAKISTRLQELGTSLRMIPLRSTFQRTARLVRDLARRENKRVELQVSGEDTELDKGMVEKLADPLLHLIRNAVDHGLERLPEDRLRRNKPAHGTIELRAYHQGGSIFIEVEDDGQGLDRDRILARARKLGLVPDGSTPPDGELYQLIFEPGFSTAADVTDVSGRGVGMDVVKRGIEELHGSIEIATEPGLGTLFTLRLPLTIAIIDGMVVRVAEERYIIPTQSIVRSVQPTTDRLSTILGDGEVLRDEDSLVPIVRLGELFEIEGAVRDLTEGLVVVVESDGRLLGLLVDELVGQQQTVIKSLGGVLDRVPGIAGGAILSDGRVGLILDLAALGNPDGSGAPLRSAG